MDLWLIVQTSLTAALIVAWIFRIRLATRAVPLIAGLSAASVLVSLVEWVTTGARPVTVALAVGAVVVLAIVALRPRGLAQR